MRNQPNGQTTIILCLFFSKTESQMTFQMDWLILKPYSAPPHYFRFDYSNFCKDLINFRYLHKK